MLTVTLLVSFLLCRSAQAATCYNSKGKAWAYTQDEPTEAWQPCNTTASVTNCCGPRDYCMNNGLCLDAVIDNMISQQGCTKSNWDTAPCYNYCGGTESDIAGLHFLWRCDGQAHCCSNNRSTTCCQDPGVKTFVLDVGQVIHQPNMVAVPLDSIPSSSSAGTSSGASTGTPTGTPTGAIAGTSQTGALPTQSSADAASSKNDSQALTIGVAVGVSIGVLLIAAILFLAIQMRNKNKKAHQDQAQNLQTAQTTATQPGLPNYYGFNQYHGQQQHIQYPYDASHPTASVYSREHELKAGSPPPVEIGPQNVGELDGTRYMGRDR